ncbi:MAG: Na+:solute symporter [Saprospiraceae bacterium]|nr:Na+:solute symporter [Saprospiraceae bacterium]
MQISTLDWAIIVAFFLVTLLIGLWVSKQSGKSAREFFLSGRNMPWWLLGVSMVATTFSADTPNLVTDIVRKNGVAGNWVWWAFLLTGMMTVFIYAKLWRRSGIMTDLEFYELRYSGGSASFLRGFRAIYLGVFFNIMIMATVMLAGIKIGGVMLGISPVQTVLLVSLITVVYATLGGLRGVILTDFFQFTLSMIGMVAGAIYILGLPEIGGLSNLVSHPSVSGSLSFLPDFNDMNVAVPLFFFPIAIQWWSMWYPGAEPGGGGYIAQRMLSARNENDAVKATLLFNVAHYALRPWPWIIIALASLVVFPDLESLKASFPGIDNSIVQDDLAFPAMLTMLPKGLMGLLIASLIAALMSTISTHLNWGSSYVVNDFYGRFINIEATESQKVKVGRISTVILMILSAIFALYLSNALQAFNILLQIGAGTGLIFILRWFWWRINAYSEIAAMIISFVIAIYFETIYDGGMEPYERFSIGVAITTIVWVAVTFLTQPTDKNVLKSFYTKIKPYHHGWKPIINTLNKEEQEELTHISDSSLGKEMGMMFLGCILVYLCLFGIGSLIYGNTMMGMVMLITSALAGMLLFRVWKS